MVRTILSLTMALALGAPLTLAQADTLIVDEMAARAGSSQSPGPGQTMAAVEARWGAPMARQAAVGDPPITRWEFSDFVVFFEYQHVIHAVRKN